jgi:hypothetical protein
VYEILEHVDRHRLDVYLDDWLIVNQNKRQLLSDRGNCLNLMKSLGFLVNKFPEKLFVNA